MMPIKLDNRDIAILKVISAEGRISKSDLAKRVHLSATACLERLKKLEKSGIVEGYHAELALAKIGPFISIFVTLELQDHKYETFQKFERSTARFDEITDCWALGGGFDYLIHVTTRDIKSYQVLMDELLASEIGISRYFTYVVTKNVKTGTAPLDFLVKT